MWYNITKKPQRIDIMRKYLIGVIFGIALTITSSVFADDIQSLIGTKVQGEFPIKVNGESLEKPAIVINGTSYLPNRAIADALGMDIKFDADLGIELKAKEVSEKMLEQTVVEDTYDMGTIDSKISVLNTVIWGINGNIAEHPDHIRLDEWKAELKKNQDELAIWEARKTALQ